MGFFKHVIDATAARVFGIGNAKHVINDVVTATPMRLLRALSEARYLLARLSWRLGAGHLALATCHARPVVLAGMPGQKPALQAAAQSHRLRRLSKSWSATGSASS